MNGESQVTVMRSSLLRALALCVAAVALIPFLSAWPEPASAIGECTDVVGRLTATPSTIDRETSTSTVLTWSVNPKSCPAPAVSIERTVPPTHNIVPLSGQMNVGDVTKTTTFVLRTLQRELARATVKVNSDPGFITVSWGRQLTPDDITKFNQQWMQPWRRRAVLGSAEYLLSTLDSSGDTAIGESMAAMVRMFDLTHDTRYLDHLFDLTQVVMKYRDDRPLDPGPNVLRPTDQIRQKVGLPAWGGGLLDQFGLHSVQELTSSLYAYPIAAFARILAEDATVRAQYECVSTTIPGPQTAPARARGGGTSNDVVVIVKRCADPIWYANRLLETVDVFWPQIHRQVAGDSIEAMLRTPAENKVRPTQDDCDAALNEAKQNDPAHTDRWNLEHQDCGLDKQLAEKPLPHNINLTFSMVLIELSRVLATPFYRQSPARASNADTMRNRFLRLIPRQQQYFVDNLAPASLHGRGTCSDHVCWYYNGAPGTPNNDAEDTDHGCMDMVYVGLFFRDIDRLRAAADSFDEKLSLGPDQLTEFAHTFTGTIAANTAGTGRNFTTDVAGTANPNSGDEPFKSNSRCEGWLELTRADPKVWELCHEMSLRIIDGQQPYLTLGNHSALLNSKQFLPGP